MLTKAKELRAAEQREARERWERGRLSADTAARLARALYAATWELAEELKDRGARARRMELLRRHPGSDVYLPLAVSGIEIEGAGRVELGTVAQQDRESGAVRINVTAAPDGSRFSHAGVPLSDPQTVPAGIVIDGRKIVYENFGRWELPERPSEAVYLDVARELVPAIVAAGLGIVAD